MTKNNKAMAIYKNTFAIFLHIRLPKLSR